MKKATSTVSLNCADIIVSVAKYKVEGSAEPLKAKVDYEKDEEKVVLTFPSELQVCFENLSTGFPTGLIQTRLYSHRRWLEA